MIEAISSFKKTNFMSRFSTFVKGNRFIITPNKCEAVFVCASYLFG